MTSHREWTEDEIREKFLQHVASSAEYWTTVELDKSQKFDTVQDEIRYRVEGALFSTLVLLDGGAGMMPGFMVVPVTDESDKQFHIDEGENYFPYTEPRIRESVVDIGGYLHELVSKYWIRRS